MNEEDRLREFFAREGPREVLAAYLFGSRAEGRPHAESDVDIGIMLDPAARLDAEGRFRLRLDLGSALIHALHQNDVDLVLLNDASPRFAATVLTEGVRVFCRDEERLTDVVRDVQLRAADLEPFLRRMEQRLLKRLASS